MYDYFKYIFSIVSDQIFVQLKTTDLYLYYKCIHKSKPLLFGVSDFTFPIYWDNMSQSDPLKVVDLDQSSTEYQTVKMDFKKTVSKTVLKV